MDDRVLIAPSILSADFGALRDAISVVESAGVDLIHVDVMDGHFVPNLTIGPPVIRALKGYSKTPLDVHLMIDNADSTVGWYLEAGADLVTVHVEACTHLGRVVDSIHEAGAQAGVSLNPSTPLSALAEILPSVDLVLLMSVNPGFGGQSFIASVMGKIERLWDMCHELSVSPVIQVDGGVCVKNAADIVRAGARALVAGNAVFGADDPKAAVRELRESSMAGLK